MSGENPRGYGGVSKTPLAASKDPLIEKYIQNIGKAKEARARIRITGLGKPAAYRRGKQHLSESMRSKYSRRAIVISNYHKLKGDGYQKLHAHIRYVERPQAGEDAVTPRMFDRDQEIEAHGRAAQWIDDRHYWRIILAPEDGGKLSMVEYTREFMAEMERHLGTKLDWMAGAHEKADATHDMNRHVHIIVRGIDQHGADLEIDRETIKHEFRRIAEEIATRHLGQLSEREYERQRERERERERNGERNYHSGRRPKKADDREYEID